MAASDRIGQDASSNQQVSLATTPMMVEYGSGPAVRELDPSAPLTRATDTAIGSAQITLARLLGVVALLGPPALAIVAIFLPLRRFGPRRAKSAIAPS